MRNEGETGKEMRDKKRPDLKKDFKVRPRILNYIPREIEKAKILRWKLRFSL